MNYWLFKTEPHTYSIAQLQKDKKTNWDHVRNYQARNNLKLCEVGDFALIYHSGDEKSVVGLAKISSVAYPDPDPVKKGEWVQVDLRFQLCIAEPVTLSEIKKTAALAELPLIKQSQLSCMKIRKPEFETILKAGNAWADFQKLK